MNWLRWYHGTTKDPKWRSISQKTGVPIPTIIAIWAALLENASESENRGSLSGWNSEDVAVCFDVTHETVVTVCNAMQQKTLLHETVIAWEKRNPKRERIDNSTDRVRAFRQRKHQETPRNTKKRLDKRRVEEKREEGKGEGNTPSASPAQTLAFGEFKRAIMTADQHVTLRGILNGSLESYINDFDRWVNEAPDAKKDGVRRRDRHAYESILSWYQRDVKEGKVKKSTERRVAL